MFYVVYVERDDGTVKDFIAITEEEEDARTYCFNKYLETEKKYKYRGIMDLDEISHASTFPRKIIVYQNFSIIDKLNDKEFKLENFGFNKYLQIYLANENDLYFFPDKNDGTGQMVYPLFGIKEDETYESLLEKINEKSEASIKKRFKLGQINVTTKHNKLVIYNYNK